MEQFKKEVDNILTAAGFEHIEDSYVTFIKQMQHGSTISINGQVIQQHPQEITTEIKISFTGDCDIKDVATEKVDHSAMYNFYVCTEGTEPQLNVSFNFYADDIDKFKAYCNKFFGI